MKRFRHVGFFCFVVLSFTLLAWSPPLTGGIEKQAPVVEDNARYFRVYFDSMDMAHDIVMSMTAVESRYEKGYVVVETTGIQDLARLKKLEKQGVKLEEIPGYMQEHWRRVEEAGLSQVSAIPGYSCYRTVEETFATAAGIVSTYPTLATWSDVGDSWEKTNGLGGYDMMVLKLTNSAVSGDKPKLLLTGAIHAREYATAELVTRFAEYMVDNYGSDPDCTWMLDHHELHVFLQTNPDGRKKAETGLSWRKNTNQDYCSPTSNYRGADLNRNFEFKWNCCGGSSGFECDTTYRGAAPASEPETQAVQAYMRTLFPDQRGPLDTDAAPLDATGFYLDIHASGRLVIWPWGWTPDPAPNDAGLATLGRKMAYFNGHTPKQAYGLYPTDGTTKLFGYGELGIPSYTIELGTQFFESCTYFENTLLPDNMPMLFYSLKVCRTPYMTPSGPDGLSLGLSAGSDPSGVPAGTVVTLTATIDDTRYNNSNGTEPSQNITAAEYYIDTPPWVTSPVPVAFAMSAVDGAFDSTSEAVDAGIDTTGLSEGRHIVFVRGQDAAGNWGAFSAVFLYINNTVDTDPPTPDPMTWAVVPYSTGPDSVSMTATTASDSSGVEYYFECLTVGGHSSGWQDSTTYTDTGLTTGTPYTYRVKARDKSVNQNETGWSTSESATPVCDIPAAPTVLAAAAPACDQIDLTWVDNASNEESFEIQRSDDGVIFAPLTSVPANSTSYSDTTVAESTAYYYRVRASVFCGDSAWSNIANATTPACPVIPPNAPSNLKAKALKYTVDLTWNDNSGDEDGFRIYRGDSPSTLVEIATVGANQTFFQDSGLTRKTYYYYKVCAYNANGEGCTAELQVRTK